MITSTKKFTLATGGTGVIDLQPTAASDLDAFGSHQWQRRLEGAGKCKRHVGFEWCEYFLWRRHRLVGNVGAGGKFDRGSITNGPVGTGTLTLSGGNLTANATRTIANTINVAASTTSNIFGSAGNITLTGALTGSGTIDNTLDTANVSRSIFY